MIPVQMVMAAPAPTISGRAAILFQGGIGVVGLLLIWMFDISLPQSDLPVSESVLMGILAALVTLVVMVLVARIPGSHQALTRKHSRDLSVFARQFPPWILVVISALAGIGEELLFRGFLQNGLGLHMSEGLAVGLAAVAFGVVHWISALYAAMAAALGLAIGLVYWQTQSLLLVMVWHGVYDLIALLILRHRPDLFDPELRAP